MTCGGCGNANEHIPADLAEQTDKHPCYSFGAHEKYARMHLPIAPACNISCNYCNRKYDCVNESRPGVTSEVLTPSEAAQKAAWVKQELPQLSVIGIAGPGDALANWPAVKESLQLIRRQDPEVVFCLSTNGLMLPDYADEMLALGVRHVTVTANCVAPALGAKIYRQVRYNGQVLTGEEGAALLLSRQQAGIAKLVAGGALVKVNIVMIPGLNDRHIPEVVARMKSLGAFMTNIMPLIPAPGSAFSHYPQTSRKDLDALRDQCAATMPQMRHCQQCRADAIGLLKKDESQRFRLHPPAEEAAASGAVSYRIAVASRDRAQIDLHYGEAEEFHIYQVSGQEIAFLETRPLPRYCSGPDACDAQSASRNENLRIISDCDAVVSLRAGQGAKENLQRAGIVSIETCNSVEDGLHYATGKLQLKAAI